MLSAKRVLDKIRADSLNFIFSGAIIFIPKLCPKYPIVFLSYKKINSTNNFFKSRKNIEKNGGLYFYYIKVN